MKIEAMNLLLGLFFLMPMVVRAADKLSDSIIVTPRSYILSDESQVTCPTYIILEGIHHFCVPREVLKQAPAMLEFQEGYAGPDTFLINNQKRFHQLYAALQATHLKKEKKIDERAYTNFLKSFDLRSFICLCCGC